MKRITGFVLGLIALGMSVATAQTTIDKGPGEQVIAKPALWKVQGKGAPIYIFGSIHLLPTGLSWRSPGVETAMKDAKIFVFESPDTRGSELTRRYFITDRGFLRPGKKLRSMLSPEGQALFDQRITEFGFIPDKFDGINPWLASIILKVTLLENLGYTSQEGADTMIAGYGRKQGKSFQYLESSAVGLRALAALGDKTGISSVESTLANMDEMPDLLDELIQVWLAGDIDKLSRMLDASLKDHPEVGAILLHERNNAWVNPIVRLADRDRPAFITVGIAHLAGEDNLIQLLCSQGLKIQRVDHANPTDACGAG